MCVVHYHSGEMRWIPPLIARSPPFRYPPFLKNVHPPLFVKIFRAPFLRVIAHFLCTMGANPYPSLLSYLSTIPFGQDEFCGEPREIKRIIIILYSIHCYIFYNQLLHCSIDSIFRIASHPTHPPIQRSRV